jgi:hypothetical protein
MKKFFLLIALFLLVSSQIFLFSQERKDKVSATEETVLPELNLVNNVLYIKNAPVKSRLEVITIVGNKVYEIEIKSSNATYDLNHLPKAIYIFKLEGVVRKFVIR